MAYAAIGGCLILALGCAAGLLWALRQLARSNEAQQRIIGRLATQRPLAVLERTERGIQPVMTLPPAQAQPQAGSPGVQDIPDMHEPVQLGERVG